MWNCEKMATAEKLYLPPKMFFSAFLAQLDALDLESFETSLFFVKKFP